MTTCGRCPNIANFFGFDKRPVPGFIVRQSVLATAVAFFIPGEPFLQAKQEDFLFIGSPMIERGSRAVKIGDRSFFCFFRFGADGDAFRFGRMSSTVGREGKGMDGGGRNMVCIRFRKYRVIVNREAGKSLEKEGGSLLML